ncbi:replication protein A subunit [Haematococcus lacustris]|uniref:Replication protein A subunit n=1 Tax=Haematococcus lacustris TaxID=44745 RepID=A0A699YAW6_HAELA|nr:replication protein A subunit [Haematococcus lacustris]
MHHLPDQVGAWSTITRKTGEETRKRAVVIRDDSNRSIEITLWGNFVDKPGNDLEQ